MENLKIELKKLLANAKIEELYKLIFISIKDIALLDMFIVIKAQVSLLENQRRLGIISNNEFNKEIFPVFNKLISLINEIH